MEQKKYEKKYHLAKHSYLYNDEEYYKVRAKISATKYLEYPLNHPNMKSVFEFGCGLGQNIYFTKRNSVGYDLSKFALDFCKEKGIEVVSDLKELKGKKFDIVLCCEVLEHLENPLKALKQMYSKLEDRGELILILPIDKWNPPNINDANQHLYNWNFNTITNLLLRVGFLPIDYKIIRMTGFKKFLPFSKISFKLYLFLIKCLAIIIGSKHMKVVAVKK